MPQIPVLLYEEIEEDGRTEYQVTPATIDAEDICAAPDTYPQDRDDWQMSGGERNRRAQSLALSP